MKTIRACGLELDGATLGWLRGLSRTEGMTRNRMARALCERMEWRDACGRLKAMSGRVVLNRLEEQGHLHLPAPRHRRMPPVPCRWHVERPARGVECSVGAIRGLRLEPVDRRLAERSRLWNGLIETYHYLGYAPLAGAQARYLVVSEEGVLGAIGFQASARRMEARDSWIGWDSASQRTYRHLVVNNTRFLILPWVKVPHLASKILSLAAKQLPRDWEARYGYRPVLLETLVESGRFKGTSYRAANWRWIGRTKGRGRQDRRHQGSVPVKDIYVYPLVVDAHERLGGRVPAAGDVCAKPGDWAEEEFAGAKFGDRRLTRRLCELARAFYAQPSANIPQACGSRASAKAAYRFFEHTEVRMGRLLTPHCDAVLARAAKEPLVLAVQDTTSVNYSGHHANGELGDIGTRAGQTRGLHLHSTLALTPDGRALGVLAAQTWIRPPEQHGKKTIRRERPIEEKESVKWLRSYEAVRQAQSRMTGTRWVSVGDREADLYELFKMATQAGSKAPWVLVRAASNRNLDGETCHLWESMNTAPVAGTCDVRVPRKPGQAERTATLSIRYRPVRLSAPHGAAGSVDLWAVYAHELAPPAGVPALSWMLLTTAAVLTFEDALERLKWYAARWQIEVFHRTLKSGCRIEMHQFRTRKELESCLALDMVVAWRILYLTHQSRHTPDADCSEHFSSDEWKAVFCISQKTSKPPAQPPTMRTMVRMVASLGGFLGRTGDKEPGAQTIWRGLQRMKDLAAAFRLFQPDGAAVCVQHLCG